MCKDPCDLDYVEFIKTIDDKVEISYKFVL